MITAQRNYDIISFWLICWNIHQKLVKDVAVYLMLANIWPIELHTPFRLQQAGGKKSAPNKLTIKMKSVQIIWTYWQMNLMNADVRKYCINMHSNGHPIDNRISAALTQCDYHICSFSSICHFPVTKCTPLQNIIEMVPLDQCSLKSFFGKTLLFYQIFIGRD